MLFTDPSKLRIPNEVGELFTKELDCSTLYRLRNQIPGTKYHYEKKCKPSNFRKDLSDYYNESVDFLRHVIVKIAKCYEGNAYFVQSVLLDSLENWRDIESDFSKFELTFMMKSLIFTFTTAEADELTFGRINMKTVSLLDFLVVQQLKLSDDDLFSPFPFPMNHELEDIELDQFRSIEIGNYQRYYIGRLFAFTLRAEPTWLRIIPYSADYLVDVPNSRDLADNIFLIYPDEKIDDLVSRYNEWMYECYVILFNLDREIYNRLVEARVSTRKGRFCEPFTYVIGELIDRDHQFEKFLVRKNATTVDEVVKINY